MIDVIQINNVNLADIIMFKLDKIDNEFTQEELNQITEIVIDLSMEDDSVFVILKEVIKLKQLQLITIRNASFENDDFSYLLQLTNLKGIVFENCEFENADLIASLFVQSLSLINCNIANYSFVNVIPILVEI